MGLPEAVLAKYLFPDVESTGNHGDKSNSIRAKRNLAGIRLGVMREWFDDSQPSIQVVQNT